MNKKFVTVFSEYISPIVGCEQLLEMLSEIERN